MNETNLTDLTSANKNIGMMHNAANIDPENDEGNIEYKYRLTNLDDFTINRRATQMQYRIAEGHGEALYFIGIMDNGTVIRINEQEYIESIDNLRKIANKIGCTVIKLSESNNNGNYAGEFIVREKEKTDSYIDIHIGVAGNVDAGKSTTIGTLTRGILDDGRGKARSHVFNHRHELSTGRTSSISQQLLGFDDNGQVVNSKFDRMPSWAEIVAQSSKVITFYDLAGHEKYLKTTIRGLTINSPDYCLILVAGNMTEMNHMTKEHIILCLSLKIPFIIIMTKVDIFPEDVISDALKSITNMCKNAKKIPYQIKNASDIICVAKNIKSDSIVPILQISNVTNYNLDLLKTLLNTLPVRNNFGEYANDSVMMSVDTIFTKAGHPTIVSGLIKSGTIKVNDVLTIGPFYDDTYRPVKVKSIHIKYRDVLMSVAGNHTCLSLKGITKSEIRNGMVVVSDNKESKIAIKEFWAKITIVHSPTTINIGYSPYMHIDQIRQVAEFVEIRKIKKPTINDNSKGTELTDALRTGDRAYVKLRFVKNSEHVVPNMKIIFREGKVKATGTTISEIDMTE